MSKTYRSLDFKFGIQFVTRTCHNNNISRRQLEGPGDKKEPLHWKLRWFINVSSLGVFQIATSDEMILIGIDVKAQ